MLELCPNRMKVSCLSETFVINNLNLFVHRSYVSVIWLLGDLVLILLLQKIKKNAFNGCIIVVIVMGHKFRYKVNNTLF